MVNLFHILGATGPLIPKVLIFCVVFSASIDTGVGIYEAI